MKYVLPKLALSIGIFFVFLAHSPQIIWAAIPNESNEIDLTVSGKVTDTDGKPIEGVSVQIDGTSTLTHTDGNGQYTLTAPEDATLIFSHIGFVPLRVSVDSQNTINVELRFVENELQEVVVLGYGSTSRRNLTTSIGSVKADELTERPTNINLVQGLAGKVAGVSVMSNSGKPGGAPSIKIRGVGSINTSSNPLYVIDGIVGADPNTIDPTIVESMDILKDAAATAIYGARGANGVVVITTKKGSAGATVISFNNTVSFGTLQRRPAVLDANGALEMFRRQYDYPFRTNPETPRHAPHMPGGIDFVRKADLFNPDGTPKYNTDWLEESTRLAISNNHSLTFSGGKDNLSVLANIAYRNNQGLLLNSYEKRLSAYVNLAWNVKPWLSLQGMVNTGANRGNTVDGGVFGSTALRKISETLPFLPIQYPDGSFSRIGDYPGAEDSENPVRLLNEIKNPTGRVYSMANLAGTFHLTKQLDFVASFGAQINSLFDYYYAGTMLRGVSESQGGVARRTDWHFGGWTNEDYLSYQNDFGKHSLNLVAGASWYYNRSTSTTSGSERFFDDYYEFNSLQAGAVISIPSSGASGNQMNSFFGRANYSFDDRYLLGATYRVDGSSRFGANNKYGGFPSFSLGWNISNERFFSGIQNKVDQLKLRASYGIVGNAEIGDYATLAKLNNTPSTFNGQIVSVVTLGSLANPNLSWESAEQMDIGLDVSLWGGNLTLTADYYLKTNRDLLYFRTLPTSSGFKGVFDNIGDIQNRGIELSLNSINVSKGNFRWTTGLNFSRNRSEVLNLNKDILYYGTIRVMEGRPLNEFYGFEREGIWGTSEEEEAAVYSKIPGDHKWRDTNNNGVKDLDDRVILGNGMPKFEANMINNFSFKGLSMLIDFQSMYGHSMSNTTKFLMQNASTMVNSYEDILNAWTPENQNTLVPALRTGGDHGSPSEVADSYAVEDASFIRLRNIGLTYRLNAEWLGKILLSDLTLGFNIENALLFTRYSGFDPEHTSFGSQLEQGIDLYQYPKPRTFSFSINANF